MFIACAVVAFLAPAVAGLGSPLSEDSRSWLSRWERITGQQYVAADFREEDRIPAPERGDQAYRIIRSAVHGQIREIHFTPGGVLGNDPTVSDATTSAPPISKERAQELGIRWARELGLEATGADATAAGNTWYVVAYREEQGLPVPDANMCVFFLKRSTGRASLFSYHLREPEFVRLPTSTTREQAIRRATEYSRERGYEGNATIQRVEWAMVGSTSDGRRKVAKHYRVLVERGTGPALHREIKVLVSCHDFRMVSTPNPTNGSELPAKG